MSFVRVGRSVPGQGKRHPVRSRKTSAPKKEWVSTVNDLSVHKLTPEEVSRRHEMHCSQNRAVAKWKQRERALRRRWKQMHPNSPGHLDRPSISISIIREVQWLRTKQSQMEPSEGGKRSVLVTQVLNPDHPLTLSGKKVRSSRATRGRSAGRSMLDGSHISSLTGNQSSLELLQGLLAQVKVELDAEPQAAC